MRAGSIPATFQRRHAQGNGRKARSQCDRAFFIIRRFCSVVGSLALSLPSLRRPPKGSAGSTSAAAGKGVARPIHPKPKGFPLILAALKLHPTHQNLIILLRWRRRIKKPAVTPSPNAALATKFRLCSVPRPFGCGCSTLITGRIPNLHASRFAGNAPARKRYHTRGALSTAVRVRILRRIELVCHRVNHCHRRIAVIQCPLHTP